VFLYWPFMFGLHPVFGLRSNSKLPVLPIFGQLGGAVGNEFLLGARAPCSREPKLVLALACA
jgi:hypothetical protein